MTRVSSRWRWSVTLAWLGCASAAAQQIRLDVVALSGEPAVGAAPGAHFSGLTSVWNHAVMAPRIDTRGNVTFVAFVAGAPGTYSDRVGLWQWSSVAHTLRLIALTGDPAPETAEDVTFAGFPDTVLPVPPEVADGNVLFQATLNGPGVSAQNDAGLWLFDGSATTRVARNGDGAPGYPSGVKLASVGGQVADDGTVLVRATLCGPNIFSWNDEALGRTSQDRTISWWLRESDPVPGDPELLIGNLTQHGTLSIGDATISANGRLAIRANVVGVGVSRHNDEVVIAEEGLGPASMIAREGDPIPTLPDVHFGGTAAALLIRDLQINEFGMVAFTCQVGDADTSTVGGLSSCPGPLEPFAIGAPFTLPSALERFTTIECTKLNPVGRVAVAARTAADDAVFPPMSGLWVAAAGTLTPKVLPHDPISGAPLHLTFHAVNQIVGFSGNGWIAMTATVAADSSLSTALIVVSPTGETHVIARVGDWLPIRSDDRRQVLRIIPGGTSASGDVAFRADFVDGASGHFVARIATTALGDLNCDGVVSVGDINAFVLALTDPTSYQVLHSDCDRLAADTNADGRVTVTDINGFLQLLSN